jgi:beta-lactamase superfamily II metal-dependent hydrolase
MSAGAPPVSGDLVVEMLPARHGDCLLVEWGTAGNRHRILVDAGPAGAYPAIAARLAELGAADLDLLVLTHIDADHIEGTILLVNDRELACTIEQIWYNGAPQLAEQLGAQQGEILGALIAERGLPWNAAFAGAAVRSTPVDAPLPSVQLGDGMLVTVLAPDADALSKLCDVWQEECRAAGLTFGSSAEALEELRRRPKLQPRQTYLAPPGTPRIAELARSRRGRDTSIANRSSIVLLLEWRGQRVLLAGDSTPAALVPPLRRLLAERGQDVLALSAFKLPHHGSAKNVDAEIVRLAPAEHYLFSSDGSYFGHPDDTAVATVLEYGAPATELIFNYDTPHTRQWNDAGLLADYRYRTRYPEPGTSGTRLLLRDLAR